MADEPTIEEVAAAKALLTKIAAHPDWDDSTTVPLAELRTLLASHASLEERKKEAGRLLVWCRARLKSDAYRATLDRMQSNPVEPDHTPVLAAFVNEKERT